MKAGLTSMEFDDSASSIAPLASPNSTKNELMQCIKRHAQWCYFYGIWMHFVHVTSDKRALSRVLSFA